MLLIGILMDERVHSIITEPLYPFLVRSIEPLLFLFFCT